MNVLSLFDGMSCGRIALERLGIEVNNYYASEIDKYAIQIAQKNYPDTKQIGDVLDWQSWDIDWSSIDLVSGGFPCQSWSLAGKQLGDKDERGMMLWVMLDIMKKVIKHNPNAYYLMENVRMKKEFEEYITYHTKQALPDVNKYLINSALVSAQNRVRYYWTNIPNVELPEDKGIVLKDILETETDEKPVKDTARNQRHYRNKDEKSLCMTATMYKGAGNNGMTLVPQKPIKVGMNVEQVKIRKHEVDITGLQYLLREMKSISNKTNKKIAEEINLPQTKVEHWFRTDSSFAIPSDDVWYKLKEVLGINTNVFDKQIMEFEYRDGVYESTQRVYSDKGKSPTLTASNKEQMIETEMSLNTPKQIGIAVDVNGYDLLKRVYSPDGKSPTLNTCGGGNTHAKVVCGAWRGRYQEDKSTKQMLELRKDDKTNTVTTVQKDNVLTKDNVYWRKLTPLECERLQTVPDNYTEGVSNTQRYKMLGNGWTVDVIAHIFANMELDNKIADKYQAITSDNLDYFEERDDVR